MSKTRLIFAAFCAVVVAAIGASSAFAGEITGNGKPLWTNTDQWGVPHALHGNSPCAFSGQEDNQFPGTVDNPNLEYSPDAGHVQNWGHTPGHVQGGGAGPAGCNPNIGGEG